MKNDKPPIKTVALFIVVFLFVLFIFLYFRAKKNQQNGSTKPEKLATFYNLQPGTSTKDDVIKALGYPKKDSTSSATPVEYDSKSPTRNNEVYFKDNVVSIIKHQVTVNDNIKIENIQSEYGKHEYKLYGPASESGFNLYVYLQKGIAYLGNEYTGEILEIWYFPKTSNITS